MNSCLLWSMKPTQGFLLTHVVGPLGTTVSGLQGVVLVFLFAGILVLRDAVHCILMDPVLHTSCDDVSLGSAADSECGQVSLL